MNPLLEDEGSRARSLHIAATVIVGISLVGFFVGTRRPEPATPPLLVDARANLQDFTALAPTYREIGETRYGPNQGWRADFSELSANLSDRVPTDAPSDEAWREGVASHLERRAYDGAPPTIPHPINDDGPLECMTCHGEGLAVDGRIARPLSHEYMPNCVQCHVRSDHTFGARPSEGVLEHAQQLGGPNAFGGHAYDAFGERAWQGAPPTIPHPTFMRSNCISCHGPTGRQGLRTSHPERVNCMQCHAPDADLDQLPPRPSALSITAPWER